MAIDQQESNVGFIVRSLRSRQGLSLRALAQRSGLSMNAISRIERGEASPTVTSLHLLASALGVAITDFFDARHELATVFTQHGRRLRSQQEGIVMESLGSGLRNQQLEPFLIRAEAGAGNRRQPVTHPGEEFVHCLEGTIEYFVDNQHYVLQPGDSLLFEAGQVHCFVNSGATAAVFLLAFQAVQGTLSARQAHLPG